MVNDSPVISLEESESINDLGPDAEIFCLDFEILDKPLHFRIAALNKPAKLSDIMPAAREISDGISEILQKNIVSNGGKIPCYKGCAFCCQYMVLLSHPEALRLLEESMHLSLKDCDKVIQGCTGMTKSVQRYLSKNNYDIFAASNMQEKFADWYLKQKKTCSFLSNNSCFIYEQRPIACREHLIVNTDISCSYEDHNDGNTLEVPISIRQALEVLTCNLEITTMESIVLPCIFD